MLTCGELVSTASEGAGHRSRGEVTPHPRPDPYRERTSSAGRARVPARRRRSPQLRSHLGRDQVQVVQVGQVEHLQVHPGRARLGEPAQGVHRLRG